MLITPRRVGALLAGGVAALVLIGGIVSTSPAWLAAGALMLLGCAGLLFAVLYRHLLHAMRAIDRTNDRVDRVERAVDRVERAVQGLCVRQQAEIQAATGQRAHMLAVEQMAEMLKVNSQHAVDAQTLALRSFQELKTNMDETRGESARIRDALRELKARVAESDVREEFARVQGTLGELEARVAASDVREEFARVQDVLKAVEAPMAVVASMVGSDDKLQHWLRHHLEWLKFETVQEYEALTQLRSMLDVHDPAPLLGGWSMDPTAIYALVGLIRDRRPQLIVECGSGASTLWLARALRHFKGGRLLSLEHSEHFAQLVQGQLRREGLEQFAEVRLAPLEPCGHSDENAPWYALSALDGIQGIDMLIVDGPPGRVARLARYPALPATAAALKDGALVVVDDAKREAETEMVRRWRKEFSGLGERSTLAHRTVAFAWNVSGKDA